ncbi:MAG: hypothetical protein H6721_10290 [Sandaracinus sp.]|nr:hypothetical protein [Sandaracinus sp.]MCB9616706.1 hypothetical protein [Sandaracinus sp.]MCB9632506.1 hypothetical protein [Sandaracinus sp.]
MSKVCAPDVRRLGEFIRAMMSQAPGLDRAKDTTVAAPWSLARYQIEGSDLMLAWGTDLSSGARLAAGLSLLPEGVVDDALRGKRLCDALEENLYEVFNIGLSLLSDGVHRVKMLDVQHGLEARRFKAPCETVAYDLRWPNGKVSRTFFVVGPPAVVG